MKVNNSINFDNDQYSKFLDIPDLKKIIEFDRLALGVWPTPLEQYDNYPNFFIKRDDLSGYGRGGIKTRKLESAFAYILAKKYTDVVLVVPNVSNLLADIKLFSIKNTLRFHLILANDPFIEKEKRQLPIDTENLLYIVAGTSKLMISLKLIKRYTGLWFKGKKAAWFFPSMAHPVSITGAALGLLEFVTQCNSSKIALPKHIFITGCTGTSAAGLLLAASILKQHDLADIVIHIVKVFPLPLKLWTIFLLYWTKLKFKLKVRITQISVNIYQNDQDVIYGQNNSHLKNLCSEVNDDFNIQIDPIYGAQTWIAMKDFIKLKYQGDGLVFWHCGYTPDWEMFNKK